MTIIFQTDRFQYVTDGVYFFFRHCRGFGVWYRIPARCRALKRAAFRALRGVA